MNSVLSDWLVEQRRQQREFILVIDSMADPDPIKYLFGADVMHDYTRIYTSSPLASFIEASPWLVRLSGQQMNSVKALLDSPEANWGWIASTTQNDLNLHTQHWLDRALIEDGAQRWLYRLQDNRVMAHHLSTLEIAQRPLLLGLMDSAICWDAEKWVVIDNPRPDFYPQPFATPWLNIAEPESVADAIVHHNLKQWLWDEHPHATTALKDAQPLDPWLYEQLQLAKTWGWTDQAQIEFLLINKLKPEIANHPQWANADGESPAQHYARCVDLFQRAAI
ncbi:DUF4123 domain-containing protein [Pseudomonas sp. M30-35]|uniref:DUF4123 domain-containing protein n=1 Tax=Pseudomonas sp. M30-35 TaxID=1981174 RepID=UPI000B3C2B1D|nr:DUF4123 domain-containing protein [Pseudomonas sp. M30-35]ARU87397.1 hypothetical protein B9K09_05135 [Pseudomonas sp. M30-35]